MAQLQNPIEGITALESRSSRFVIAGFLVAANFTAGINLFLVSPLYPRIIDEYGITWQPPDCW